MKSIIVLATRNSHKREELSLLVGQSASWVDLKSFPGAPDVAETASSFEGNAMLKARSLAEWLAANADILGSCLRTVWPSPSRVLILADDSGLEVDALDGAPGIFSARFAAMDTGKAGNSSDSDNNSKLLRLLSGRKGLERGARFRCALAAIELVESPTGWLPREPVVFSGSCEGQLLEATRGAAGFGYDPLFVPRGFQETFAELGETVKNRISHRAAAVAGFRDWLSSSTV